MVNITGGSDLTLFEVEEAVNKIRAEVDSEAELIFGAIEDENLNRKIRVSIVATSLDGQEPETKPVISMVHRLHNRNVGYSDNVANTLSANQTTLNATEGATALDINTVVNKNTAIQQRSEQEKIKKTINEPSLGNISMENAAYLQNVENDSKSNDDIPNFEVDSIELTTPELFSSDLENGTFNQENNEERELEIFENLNFEKKTEIKDPEMFEESNLEEDFELPAFLRRQKN